MNKALAVLATVLAAWVTYAALWGDVTSFELIVSYTVTGLLCWFLSSREPDWRATIKWCWVALSLVVIYAIVTGPLDYLRLQSAVPV